MFMKNLVKVIENLQISHVFKVQDAMDHLLKEKVPLVVLDNDTVGLDPQSFSKVIRLNYPASRIIIISQSYTSELLVNLINLGQINAFLAIPTTDHQAYSVILEQDAQNQIYEMLNSLIREPPKFSPAYFLMHDEEIEFPNVMLPFSLLGSVISHKGVVKHIFIGDELEIKNNILLAIYFSAINSMDDQLFQEERDLRRLDFANITLLFQAYKGLEFTFIFTDLTKINLKFAENLIIEICEEIEDVDRDALVKYKVISDERDQKLSSLVKTKIQALYNPTDTDEKLSFDKVKFGIFENTYLGINTKTFGLIETSSSDMTLIKVKNYDQLFDLAHKQLVDIVIISLQDNNIIIDLARLRILKEISPRIQILGLLADLEVTELWKIIDSNLIDFVFASTDSLKDTEKTIDRAFHRALIIRTNSIVPRPLNLQFPYEQTSIAKSILRLHPMVYSKIQIPSLLGVLILRDGKPYYSDLWSDTNESIVTENRTLKGFISSLIHFNSEVFKTPYMISTLKFDNLYLVILNYFELSFVFFTKEIDDTNVFLVYEHITQAATFLYELLAVANVREAWTSEFEETVKQHITELFLKFTSISLTIH